jgi:hypothetical protein
MRFAIRAFNLVALLLATPHFALAGQAPPSQRTVCGKVERVMCEEKVTRFTTLELKPKSKDLPVTILSTSRAQFTPSPEELYRDTEVCATGRVELEGPAPSPRCGWAPGHPDPKAVKTAKGSMECHFSS